MVARLRLLVLHAMKTIMDRMWCPSMLEWREAGRTGAYDDIWYCRFHNALHVFICFVEPSTTEDLTLSTPLW